MPRNSPCPCCDGDEFDCVRTVPWATGEPRLDAQFETAVFECDGCGATRWERQRRTTTLAEFGDDHA